MCVVILSVLEVQTLTWLVMQWYSVYLAAWEHYYVLGNNYLTKNVVGPLNWCGGKSVMYVHPCDVCK